MWIDSETIFISSIKLSMQLPGFYRFSVFSNEILSSFSCYSLLIYTFSLLIYFYSLKSTQSTLHGMMKAFTVLYIEKANNPPGAALCDSVKEKPPFKL